LSLQPRIKIKIISSPPEFVVVFLYLNRVSSQANADFIYGSEPQYHD